MFVLDFVTDIFMDFNSSAFSPDLDDHTISAAVVGTISTDNPDIALAVDPICNSDFPSEVSYFSTDARSGFGPGFRSDIGTGSTLDLVSAPSAVACPWLVSSVATGTTPGVLPRTVRFSMVIPLHHTCSHFWSRLCIRMCSSGLCLACGSCGSTCLVGGTTLCGSPAPWAMLTLSKRQGAQSSCVASFSFSQAWRCRSSSLPNVSAHSTTGGERKTQRRRDETQTARRVCVCVCVCLCLCLCCCCVCCAVLVLGVLCLCAHNTAVGGTTQYLVPRMYYVPRTSYYVLFSRVMYL